MKRNGSSPLPPLIVGILIIAVCCTVMIDGGWVVWLPVVAALAVIGNLWSELHR